MGIERIYDTDVLIVGGGAGAARAAVAATMSGARTLIALKKTLGHSGSTNYPRKGPYGSAWQAADGCSGSEDSPDVHFQDIMQAALGMADARMAAILAQEAPERLRELESWGFRLIKDPNGHHPHYSGFSCFGTQPRAHGMLADATGGHTGNMVATLAERFQAGGGTVHQDVSVVDLLVRDGACVGALALDGDGNLVAYRAGAVVLATGGAAQIFPLSSTPGEITGDGYAMAFRAGTELVNMEFMQYMARIVAGEAPRVGGPFWAAQPILRNAQGDDVLARYLPPGISSDQAMTERTLHYPFSSRDMSCWIDIAIQTEIREGRGTPRNGLVLDFSQVDLRQVTPARPQHSPAPTKLAIPEQFVEVSHSAHAVNGGIWIDEFGHSTVPGLFAVGETIAGPHGADRLGGGMLSACNVFGARAGRQAAEFARNAGVVELPAEVFAFPQDRLARFGRGTRGNWFEIRKKLKALCARHLLVVRRGGGLTHLLSALEELRGSDLPDVPVSDPTTRLRVLETDNLLFVAQVMARAALLRTESRGSHFREDHPARDDKQWNASIFWHNEHGEPTSYLGQFRQDPASDRQVGAVRRIGEVTTR